LSKSHRNRVLGLLQVEARAIKDVDKTSAAGMQRESEFEGEAENMCSR
jgi:hypothetical protein